MPRRRPPLEKKIRITRYDPDASPSMMLNEHERDELASRAIRHVVRINKAHYPVLRNPDKAAILERLLKAHIKKLFLRKALKSQGRSIGEKNALKEVSHQRTVAKLQSALQKKGFTDNERNGEVVRETLLTFVDFMNQYADEVIDGRLSPHQRTKH